MRFDSDYSFDEFMEYLFQFLFDFSYDVETPGQD